MADKTGTEALNPSLQLALERLCLEYQGLAYIAHHYVHNEKPKHLLNEYCSLKANVSHISRLLGEVLENLQNYPESAKLAQVLTKVRVEGLETL